MIKKLFEAKNCYSTFATNSDSGKNPNIKIHMGSSKDTNKKREGNILFYFETTKMCFILPTIHRLG